MSALRNYYEIYLILTSQEQSRFTDEKHLVKFVQDKIFERLLTGAENRQKLLNLEILSLNLISNAVVTLRQFKILEKSFNDVTQKAEYSINLLLLRDLNSRLFRIIEGNVENLKKLVGVDNNCDFDLEFSFDGYFPDSKL